MNKKSVLITGGTGYIGSHTAVALIEAGYKVVVVDNLSNSDKDSLDGIEKITGVRPAYYEVDTCDKNAFREVFKKEDFDSVIHFAAYKAVGESMENPLKYYGNNIISFLNVMDLMLEFGRNNVLFSSSATVYGDADQLPVTEQTPRKPAESPYGNTKQIAEDILRDSCRAYEGIYGVALRYFNPIGAHSSALIGELPRGVPANLLPYVTQTAAGIRKELSVFGDDYNTPDGTCLRDYIDVNDLAEAHVATINRMIEGKMESKYEVFNVGTGRAVSVLELVNGFQDATGCTVPYKIAPRRAGDVPEVWADTARANEVLGWKAKRSLRETLASAWAWEKRIRNL